MRVMLENRQDFRETLPAHPEDNGDEWARLSAYAERLGLPVKQDLIEELEFKDTLTYPIQYFKRVGLVPLNISNGTLTVAVNHPLNFQMGDDLARELGCSGARFVLATRDEIQSAINLLYDQSSDDAERMVQDLESSHPGEMRLDDLEELEDLMDATHEAPIIRIVNVMLTQALRRKASDIHIEPYEKELKVRFRIDGILHEVFSLSKRFQAHIVSRLKVMADLDIAEKRLPQDGRMKIKVASKAVDIRVSIIPMAFGERIVLRLLDKTVSLLGLEDMGLSSRKLAVFERLIKRTSGILLVTGPTGSGKTTTLYAAITLINSSEKNVITIEDPIEYELRDVGQIQVNPKTQLSFARGLRSVLRHDPDIIMVGEIRDLETVEIAVQASLTGHLVFSTLHTNDAAGALTRLVDMGVEPFLTASSLIGVVAQRLVRKICPECMEPYAPDNEILEEIGLSKGLTLFRGTGCKACMGSGYRGRTAIFELLVLDDEIRKLIISGADAVTIKNAAMRGGMSSLFQDGLSKVREGVTTLNEVMRVTQE